MLMDSEVDARMFLSQAKVGRAEGLIAILVALAGGISLQEYRSFQRMNDYVAQSAEWTRPPTIFATQGSTQGEMSGPDEERPSLGLQTRTIYVTCGDTLSSILSELGISLRDIDAIGKALAKVQNAKHLQIGQALDLQWEVTPKATKLRLLETQDAKGNRISLTAQDGGYKVILNERVLESKWCATQGVVRTNFVSAAKSEGVPTAIVLEAIQALNPLVKARQLGASTLFEIVYEEKKDASTGKRVGRPSLRYVAVKVDGKTFKVYCFGNQYYTEQGESLKTEFLILPFKNKNVGVSSKFGFRKHPILGVVKKHYGVDYSARYGTDVCAAANGVVVMAGYYGAYGLYIRLKHANGFETAYGHLSSIRVKKGDRVNQGDCIGKVGCTGRATGPHLHHEVIRNQVRVDPQKYTSLGSTKLGGKEMARFRKFKEEVNEQIHLGHTPV